MADEYILRSIAIAKLTALEVTDPFATIADAKRVLADMAAADVASVAHGKWGDNGIAGSMLVKCSVCDFDCGANSFSYCPNCGARMRQAKREAEKLICENRKRLMTPSCEGERGMEGE